MLLLFFFVYLGRISTQILIKNSMSSQTLTQSYTVSNINCMIPTIELDQLSALFYQPMVYKMSDIVDICATVWVNCSVTQTYTRSWRVSRVDALDGSSLANVDLGSNPTSSLNNLIIQPKILAAGLYKLSFTVF